MIYRWFCRAMQLIGLVPAQEVVSLSLELYRLELENKALQERLKECLDENQSLWAMLDEISNASQPDSKTVNDFLEEIKDTIMEEMLKDFDPIGEA